MKVLLKIKFAIECVKCMSFVVIERQKWLEIKDFLTMPKNKTFTIQPEYNPSPIMCYGEPLSAEKLLKKIKVIDDQEIVNAFMVVHGNCFFTCFDFFESLFDEMEMWEPEEERDGFFTNCVDEFCDKKAEIYSRYCRCCLGFYPNIRPQCKFIYDSGKHSGERCRQNVIPQKDLCKLHC